MIDFRWSATLVWWPGQAPDSPGMSLLHFRTQLKVFTNIRLCHYSKKFRFFMSASGFCANRKGKKSLEEESYIELLEVLAEEMLDFILMYSRFYLCARHFLSKM